jgi:hypothetical protein
MEHEIDALFKLPLDEFTSARNALAARLEKAGQGAQADAVKRLPKPSVAAWVVNQLYWHHREPFDRLIEAGDRFRQAQSAQGSHGSAATREHLEARRHAQTDLAKIATDVLHDAGSSAARDMLRRVTSTLEALATYGSLPDAPRAGRLTAELAPPGFDLLAGLLPSSGMRRKVATRERAPKATRREDAREQERRRLAVAAKAAVREAERALRAARARAERAASALETAAKRARESERRRVEAEKQLAKIVTETDASRERARGAEANAREAALTVESAERALDQARRKLDEP